MANPAVRMAVAVLVGNARMRGPAVMRIRESVSVCQSVQKARSAVTMVVMEPAVKVAKQGRLAARTTYVFARPSVQKARSVVMMVAMGPAVKAVGRGKCATGTMNV